VNLGVHFAFLPGAGNSSGVEFSSISQPDCEIQKRLAWNGDSDCWWDYNSPEESANDIAACYLENGVPFFEKFKDFPAPFVSIRPDEFDDDAYCSLFPLLTKVRKVLLLARVHDFLGNVDLATQFAQLGENIAGRAVGPRAAFREILRKYKD
jgi:hypothetical protein